ncbi:glycoside hydrolase family 2 protein [Bacteroides xylanisolvens]|uniref:glycoside hydrolase family 2 protein n=1 Tax=Bacteroides xylanisolvens TaxID=371601 RepID=UPI00374F27B5
MRKTHLVLVGLLLSITLNATNDIPRPEYPRPQFERAEWVNLNGTWNYEFDFSNSGKNRQLTTAKQLGNTITVPFCPESKLSGVNYTDFIEQMWYQRSISIPENWKGKKILLNFGAVDYHAEIYIDGNYLGNHDGGSSSFSLDITPAVQPGNTHNLVVFVADKTRSGLQAVGKQSTQYNSYGCFYTRVTGIWQTVWMEAVSPYGLRSARTYPDIDQQQLIIVPEFYRSSNNETLEITLYDNNRQVSRKVVKCNNGSSIILPVKKMKLWSPESPYLYDITYRIKNVSGEIIDEVKSYVGMRKIHTSDGQIYLNNEPYFQRLVLNQGYYPEGIWTAPTDEALKNDIQLSKDAGFNGARLHQKVFEERFHYWADKLGFITWGESANWGMNNEEEKAARYFLSEWSEILMRDCNHPSIIAWVPFNQPLENPYTLISGKMPRLIIDTYRLTKAIDPTRLVNGIAGDIHFLTDIWGDRDYESDITHFAESLKPNKKQAFYNHQPFFIGEFGGMLWTGPKKDKDSWGYGKTIINEEGFYKRLEELMNTIANAKEVTGFCYTQLTDIEQEKNGIYYYDRSPKLDMQRIKSIFEKIPSNRSLRIEE